ncbi:MAG: N-formylglutamate amidohydrolase [Pseudomonadota bacterium]
MSDQTEFSPVETIAPGAAPGDLGNLLLLCDHASNAVPPDVGDLGIAPQDMARHIAWDVGARGVTLGLADRLGAGAVMSCFSRLVIDPNRGERDPTILMKLYDGTIIEGNRHAGPEEKARRVEAYWRPYHTAITTAVDAIEAEGRPAIISIHSFTPYLKDGVQRPWHIGLLWDRDDRIKVPLFDLLQAEPDLVVGDNQPYSGQLGGDSMWTHATSRGIPHVLIEIRNDLIETPDGQAAWADRLAPMFRTVLAGLGLAGKP